MAKYRVTIPSITWLGDHNAPSFKTTVNSRNARLAVHAAYQKAVRAKTCLCYDHNFNHARVVRLNGNKLTVIGNGKARQGKPAEAFKRMMGLAA